jgi:hypothetical protein
MAELIIGGEALANGELTHGQLRWNYRTMLPEIYGSSRDYPGIGRPFTPADCIRRASSTIRTAWSAGNPSVSPPTSPGVRARSCRGSSRC